MNEGMKVFDYYITFLKKTTHTLYSFKNIMQQCNNSKIWTSSLLQSPRGYSLAVVATLGNVFTLMNSPGAGSSDLCGTCRNRCTRP